MVLNSALLFRKAAFVPKRKIARGKLDTADLGGCSLDSRCDWKAGLYKTYVPDAE